MAETGSAKAPAAPEGAGAATSTPEKYGAQTQNAADKATIQRIEGQIKSNPLMGLVMRHQAEVNSRASSEGGEINGKVAESKAIVEQNKGKAPPEAGAPPAPGVATHPAVPHPAAAGKVNAEPKPAGGGEPGPHAKGPAVGGHQPEAGGKPAVNVPAGVSSQLAGATSDPQVDAILNAYSPKSQEAPQTLSRISQMANVAKGFEGQMETYVSGANVADKMAGGIANWAGAGKDLGAVWKNNPYREINGWMGGFMTGLSAVRNVASIVGAVCGKIGMILTIVGLLGMIFPPIGGAVSGVARILSVIGIICDAVGFILGAILTAMNGVRLAQQIASGASAEEKAATADLLMTEASSTSGSLISLAQSFGGGFMKGLKGASKGVVANLIKRFKGVIGKITGKVGANIAAFGKKVMKKIGLGGENAERNLAGGGWKKGVVGRTGDAITKLKDGTARGVQRVQDAVMNGVGKTKLGKKVINGLDNFALKSNAVADVMERRTSWINPTTVGTKTGERVGNLGEKTAFNKHLIEGNDKIEAATKRFETDERNKAAREAGDLEKERWQNEFKRRQERGVQTLSPEKQQSFAAAQAKKAKDEEKKKLEDEARRSAAREAEESGEYNEAKEIKKDRQKLLGKDGKAHRDEEIAGRDHAHDEAHEFEEKRATLVEERDKLAAKPHLTDEEKHRLETLNEKRIPEKDHQVKLRDNERDEKDEHFSKLAGNGESGQKRMHDWEDLKHNWASYKGMRTEGAEGWENREKDKEREEYMGKKRSVGTNAAGEQVTVEQSQNETKREKRMAVAETFTGKAKVTGTLASRTRGLLSSIASKPAPKATAPTTAPTAGPTAAPTAAPTSAPTSATAGPTTAASSAPAEMKHEAAPNAVAPHVAVANELGTNEGGPPAANGARPDAEPAAAQPQAAPANDEADAGGGGGGDALPYWPDLMPKFGEAGKDFDHMRKVAVEFKKAQIEGKQKAVNVLGIYGKYKEYAEERKKQAAAQQQSSKTTTAETAQNSEHAGEGGQQSNQGEAKQNQAKGEANDRSAINIPEPEATSWWGRLLGQVKTWAKNKAAAVLGWIQDKVASVILECLCGISMGDLREYTGALKRQQAAAHGVGEHAGETAGEAAGKSEKTKSDADQATSDAKKDIEECDQNLGDADAFLADISQYESQLSEEKVAATSFIAQVHAAARAEQAKKKAEEAKKAAAQKASAGPADAPGAPGADEHEQAAAPVAAAPVAADPIAGAAPDTVSTMAPEEKHEEHEGEEAEAEAEHEKIHSAIELIGEEGESMSSQLDVRVDEYTNDLATAGQRGQGDKWGDWALHEHVKGAAAKEAKHTTKSFEHKLATTKAELSSLGKQHVDPSSARAIADQVIAKAEDLDHTYDNAQHTIDSLFETAYKKIGEMRAKSDEKVADAQPAGFRPDGSTKTLPENTPAWSR